jgi:hypothetical protein
MPFEVTFQNFNSWPQTRIIPDATLNQAGVMTPAQVAALAGLTGLPDQTGNAGKFLETDGSVASWQSVSPDLQLAALNTDTPPPSLDGGGLTVTPENAGFTDLFTVPVGKTHMRVKFQGIVILRNNTGLPSYGWFGVQNPDLSEHYPTLPAGAGIVWDVVPGNQYKIYFIPYTMNTQGGGEPSLAGDFAAQFDIYFFE